ncbi:MAG: hypothetical protein PHD03_01940 [Bacilli bacterium]|nr:hypothetical protein [Bacilli bacterium]
MKKCFILVTTLLFIPISVNAAEYTDTFKIGDRLEVFIVNDQVKKEFHVIRPSATGEQYVWMMLNGNVENYDDYRNSITVYDQTLPGEHEATTVLEDALPVYNVLINGTTGWRIEGTPRLLNAEDLTVLGINISTSGKYEIMGDRNFIAPTKTDAFPDPSGYNYWTQIADSSATNASVFAVTYNESYNGDSLTPVATLESYNITSVTENPEFIVRPVVKVDKKYIDCIISDSTTPVGNVKTSEVKMPIEAIAIIGVATLAYILIRKKDIFNKI